MANKKIEKKESHVLKYAVIFSVLLIIAYVIYAMFIKKNDIPEEKFVVKTDPMEQYKNIPEPQFKKEGILSFLDSTGKKEIKKLEIEIADNPPERSQGMMYRRSMDDNKAMLFTFPTEEEQSFWMHNTLMPLDIIYLDKSKKIVKIYKNTTPLSDKSLSSEKPAMYVVETAAGWTDRYGVKPGDKIDFKYD